MTKRDKDVSQAEALILALLDRRSDELRLIWEEAYGRGPRWRKLILGGMTLLSSEARDLLLKTLQKPREILPGMELIFSDTPPLYDSSREVVSFAGEALGHPVKCAVSREALDDYFGSDEQDKKGALATFHRNRSKIERMVKVKYMSWPIEERDTVLLTTADVERLSK